MAAVSHNAMPPTWPAITGSGSNTGSNISCDFALCIIWSDFYRAPKGTLWWLKKKSRWEEILHFNASKTFAFPRETLHYVWGKIYIFQCFCKQMQSFLEGCNHFAREHKVS